MAASKSSLGVLGVKEGERVPGTTRYFGEDPNAHLSISEIANLKKDPKTGIILTPQPSDDPNDPLNWSIGKRDLITFVLCWSGILATCLGSILAANTIKLKVDIFRESRLDLTGIVVLTGYFLLGAGAAAIFFVPSGRIWGKRHLFVIGLALVVASSAWAGAVGHDYKSMIGARVVQGIACAPFESMLNAAVGDLYFVHERGWRMAFANLAIFGSAFFTPIVTGKITASLSFYWTMNLVAIFSGVTFPALILLCPETAYRRASKYNTDFGSGTTSGGEEPKGEEEASPATGPATGERLEYPGIGVNGLILLPSLRPQPIGNASTPKKTFWESLSFFDGTKTDDNYFMLLFRPFFLIANPTFIWACLIQGTMIGWTVFIGVILGALFIGPPYFWGEVYAGYAYAPGFIGALVAFVICGVLADPLTGYLTKKNGGLYEPEFRLFLIIPMIITGAIGLFGFAMVGGEVFSGRYSFYIPLTFFGFEVCSMVIGTVGSALYVVDAYRDISVEGFTLMIIFKNFFSYILTYFAVDWLAVDIKRTMLIVSGVQIAICLTTIPLYFFGKRCRSFFHRHDVFAPLNALGDMLSGK